MKNYLVIGVGYQIGHAAIVSMNDTGEELFWAIDEHFSPRMCVFQEIVFSTSFYFPVSTELDEAAKPETDEFVDLNHLTPSCRQIPDPGEGVGMALSEWAEELWKIANNKKDDNSSCWKCFGQFDYEFIPYFENERLLNEIKETIKSGDFNNQVYPDEMPSFFEKAMTMLLKNPQGITHLDVGCNSDDLGAIMFAVQNGYLEQLNSEASKEVTH